MDANTAILFTEQLIKKTKVNEIRWQVADKEYFINLPFRVTSYFYSASVKQGTLLLGKFNYNSIDCKLYIIPLSGASYDLSDFVSWYDNEIKNKYTALVKNLYDYVYHSLPNIDSFMSSFLEN